MLFALEHFFKGFERQFVLRDQIFFTKTEKRPLVISLSACVVYCNVLQHPVVEFIQEQGVELVLVPIGYPYPEAPLVVFLYADFHPYRAALQGVLVSTAHHLMPPEAVKQVNTEPVFFSKHERIAGMVELQEFLKVSFHLDRQVEHHGHVNSGDAFRSRKDTEKNLTSLSDDTILVKSVPMFQSVPTVTKCSKALF